MEILRRAGRWGLVVAILAFFLVGLGWPIVAIQLRLSRNRPVAQRLAQSLEVRHPGVEFRGAASYREDVIYVSVYGRLDEADHLDVERWLRTQIIESAMTTRVILRYFDDEIDKELN